MNETFVHIRAHPVQSNISKACKVSGAETNITTLGGAYKELEEKLFNTFLVMHKLGASASPWGVSKNATRANEAADDIKAQVPLIKAVFVKSLDEYKGVAQEVVQLRMQLAQRESRNDHLRYECEKLKSSAAQLEEELESHGVVKTEFQELCTKVETMTVENTELIAGHEELQKYNPKKLKAENEKLKQDIEARDCEVRRLQSELKRISRQDGSKTLKEQSSGTGKSSAEYKMLQKRFDTAKADLEHAKSQLQLLQTSTDEANIVLTGSKEESEVQSKKLSALQKLNLALQEKVVTGSPKQVRGRAPRGA